MLIEAGADPNDGETPYHMVEHDGVPSADTIFPKLSPMSRGIALGHKTDYPDHRGMRKLLELGGDPNGPSPFDTKPLHQAVFRGHDKAFFDLLFEYGADPNLRNGQGRTAYALAARSGRSDIMGWLREQGASEELGGTDRFVGSCALGEQQAVRDILASDPGVTESLDERDRAQICEAAAAGNTAGVRTMLNAGWDVNTPGTVWKETALHRAALEGHVETVELLVDRGADLTIRDRSYHSSPLGWADHGGKARVRDLLLRDPTKLDLRDAFEYGKVDRAIELLRDVDPNAALAGGEPGVLLRSAAHGGHLRLVEYLLDRGADPSSRNSEGNSPLDYARQRSHSEVAKLLESRSGG